MNTEASSAKQIAQSGIIPEAQVAPQIASWIGLTPQDLRHPFMQSHQRPGAGVARLVLAEQEQAQLFAAVAEYFTVDTFFLFAGTVFVLVSGLIVFVAPVSVTIMFRTFTGGTSVFLLTFALAYAKL